MTFEALKPKVTTIISQNISVDERLLQICELLEANVSHYNWVGY